jgi:hypothetical protein
MSNQTIPLLIKKVPWRPVKWPRRRRERGPCRDPQDLVQAVFPRSIAWFTYHPQNSRTDLHSSKETASSTNCSSSSTTVPPLHHNSSRWHSDHHNSWHLQVTRATIVRKLATSPRTAAGPSKTTHRELYEPWWTSIGASTGSRHRTLATPTTPLWRRFPWERKC